MHRGTGIFVHQQPFENLQIGDTFFDADFGSVIWNGTTWQSNVDVDVVRDLQIGDLVHYINGNTVENGRIKSISIDDFVFVVYHCNEDWENFNDYTGQLTHIKHLKNGWKDERLMERNPD